MHYNAPASRFTATRTQFYVLFTCAVLEVGLYELLVKQLPYTFRSPFININSWTRLYGM